jgi:hypothetical protein
MTDETPVPVRAIVDGADDPPPSDPMTAGAKAAHRQFVLFVSPQTRLREGVSRGLLRVQRAPGLLNRRSAESVECLLWPARDRLENREDDVGDVTVRLKCLAV